MGLSFVAYVDQAGGQRGEGTRPPAYVWLDGIPQRARLKLIAILELLLAREDATLVDLPLVCALRGRLRAVCCRLEGTRYVLLLGIAAPRAGEQPDIGVLLHGVESGESTVSRGAPVAPEEDVSLAERRLATFDSAPWAHAYEEDTLS